jgi:uncharacterized coiled-coil protein SlyX
MTLLDQFLRREKINRRLAAAEMRLARAKTAIAALSAVSAEMAEILDEARPHVEALLASGWGRAKDREIAN